MKKATILIALISFLAGMGTGRLFAPHSEQAMDSCLHEDVHEDSHEVILSKEAAETLEFNTVEAKRAPLVEKVTVRGQIAQDAVETIHVKAPHNGSIVECRTKLGSSVKKDELLCVLRNRQTGNLSEIKSPINGVVISDYAKQGEEIDNLAPLHTVADLSRLYANFDVYERDIAALKTGQKILISSSAWPGKTFKGELVFISPRVDHETRTIKIRAIADNPLNLLKLGMFVNGEVIVESQDSPITIPKQAILYGEGTRMVFVQTGDNKFEPRAVIVTKEAGELAAIGSGLKEGDRVVINNAFLLKSELFKAKLDDGCAH
jgi:multidrug efflux pump subunit AcrA (membrane-fusion protein)